MRAVVAVLVGLWAFAASAGDPCIGMPVKRSNAVLAENSVIRGTEPKHSEVTTCGGGVNSEGGKVKRWPCFIQLWRVEGDLTLRVFYGKVDDKTGPWRVSNVQMCNEYGRDCTTINVAVCGRERPASDDEPATEGI